MTYNKAYETVSTSIPTEKNLAYESVVTPSMKGIMETEMIIKTVCVDLVVNEE